MAIKIAFYLARHGSWKDRIVSTFTFSKYSHCELILSDGLSYSASHRDNSVRAKFIEYNDKWHIFDLLGDFDQEAIKYWFAIHQNDKYDWCGAIGSAFGIDITTESKKFCSHACGIVLGLDAINTPQSLLDKLLDMKMIEK